MKRVFILLFLVISMSVSAQNEKCLDGLGPKSGLKAFVEVGYTAGTDLYAEDRISFIMTAGWQFNPYFFAGLGSGENYFSDSKKYGIPFYVDLRSNILDNSKSLFLDFKIGYSIADIEGFFLSPSVGWRYGFRNNTALTLSMGYELQKSNSFNNDDKVIKSNHRGGMTLKMGFEF